MQEILDHKQIKPTLYTYSYGLPSMQNVVAGRLENYCSSRLLLRVTAEKSWLRPELRYRFYVLPGNREIPLARSAVLEPATFRFVRFLFPAAYRGVRQDSSLSR